MVITSFDKAISYINQFIPKTAIESFDEALWFARAQEFAKLLGNPQEKLKIIHIAGTSGKGSTAYLTSLLLKSQGFRVGLTVSPHIKTPLERIQLNNTLIDKDLFVKTLNKIIPAIESMKSSQFGAPSYFEIFTALAFVIFAKENVDYVVVETGLGGKSDATNVVKRSDKISVITNIGFDHVKILGNSLSKIASAKAGIIQKGNTVISAKQFPSAKKVIEKKAKEQLAQLLNCSTDFGFKNIRITEQGSEFDFWIKNDTQSDVLTVKINVGLIGKHQVENCSLALAVLYHLSKRDGFVIDEKNLKNSLQMARFVGRFDIVRFSGHPELARLASKRVSGSNKKEMLKPFGLAQGTVVQHDNIVILDGAHNPQKMAAFIGSLETVYPHQKFTFLITFINTKDYKNILKYIVPLASEIIVTSLVVTDKDWLHVSQESEAIRKAIYDLRPALPAGRFKNVQIIENPKEAIEYCLQNSKNKIVVTGSLYLLSEVYKQI